MNECNNSKILYGLIAGFAVGILAGAFLASDTAKTARDQLGDNIKKTGEEAYKKIAGIVTDLKDKIKATNVAGCDNDIEPI